MCLIYYLVDKSLYIIRILFIMIDCQFSNLTSVVTYHCMDVLWYRRYKCMGRKKPIDSTALSPAPSNKSPLSHCLLKERRLNYY